MNKERNNNSLLSAKKSEIISLKDSIVEASNTQPVQDVQIPPQTTSRLLDQMSALPTTVRKLMKAFKSYILCSEDDADINYSLSKHHTEIGGIDKEPVFVLVDSSGLSNPSSKELLIDNAANFNENVLRKYFHQYIKPEAPSTSADVSIPNQGLRESESKEEIQMIDINLQSDNDISVVESDHDNESIVLAYLRDRDVVFQLEGTLLKNKKKASIIESVPRMETIVEGRQFSSFPSTSTNRLSPTKEQSNEDLADTKISEDSLDVHIPSFPGSPRSIKNVASEVSLISLEKLDRNLRRAVDYLHRDNEFLIAAEIGNDKILEFILRAGTDIQQVDHLGRTALHLAVCADSFRAIMLLLQAGVKPNVKDNVGMTPLSLCLMRRPSLLVANVLFDYGAVILNRSAPMDTGLFIQFVMMCTPTNEEENILRLLVQKGAMVNDPDAPGGRQALHFAAMSNNCPLIVILMDLGADLYLLNHRNETPREVAVSFKCRNAQSLLEEFEAEYMDTQSIATSMNYRDSGDEDN